ncbi:MAG TPA: PAS domain-containing protein [Aquabacterium sp.]|uniref:PAS domain-containing protein n=1 Tax=Aquabacterium sp. TaxID=1872578 RepID=UPI002E3471EB|nr:PAS domain-containing protein [Aquabacterium sp.]HEX5357143.1 PAS domain-containing protein [Aquabacterium sp.]
MTHAPAEINMTTPTNQLIRLGDLRQRAHARLSGLTPSANLAASATAALGVLHELASSPETAADALALLHELQVHQVEIEMQSEDLRAALAEADAALQRQVQYLNAMPVACVNIDASGRLLAINQIAAHWLGLDQAYLQGQTLGAYTPPLGSADLHQQIQAIDHGLTPRSWHTALLTDNHEARPLLAAVSADPANPGHYIVALMPMPAGAEH